MLYTHSELMVLLEGAMTLQDETGARHTFGPHDIFVVEQGPGAAGTAGST